MEARELMPFLVSGGLDEREKRVLALHLAGCRECMADLTQVMGLRGLFRQQVSSLPTAPPEVREAVAAALRAGADPLRSNDDLRRLVFDAILPAVADSLLPGPVASLLRYPLALVSS